MSTQRVIDFRYAPPVSWTNICYPDDPYKSLVSESGALLYGFDSLTFFSWRFKRVIEFSLVSADKPIHVTQQTESARVPVVVTTITYPTAVLQLRTFAHLDAAGRRTDIVLWEIQVNQEVDEILTGLHIDLTEQGVVFTGRSVAPARTIYAVPIDKFEPPDFWRAISTYHVEDESVPPPGDLVLVSAPQRLVHTHPTGFRYVGSLSTEPRIVKGGETMHGALILPLNYQDSDGLDESWAYRALNEARQFWLEYPLLRRKVQVPDPAVMDMVVALARNILQAREIKDGFPIFQVGSTCYRGLWVVDGHFLLEVAQYLGYEQDALRGIDALLQYVHPDGSIARMPFHTKESAIAIATLIRQTELSGREDKLRELWPVILNAVSYIEGLRAQADALPENAPGHGLMPPAFGDGGVGGERGEYTTPLWTLFGLKAAAEAAERLGYAEDATRIRQDFETLLSNFRAHVKRHQKLLPDGVPYIPPVYDNSGMHHWIPGYPEVVQRQNELQPQSATWALCQAIWPGEVFAPDDPIVQNLLHLTDLIDDEEGIPANTGWLPYRAVWNYHASFAAHVWLYAGRPDKAVDYLYAFANHAAPTRVWREEQSLKSSHNGQMIGDMPHNWASAEFIRIVRHLLVFERGETLELLPGLPENWIFPGAIVELEETPTRFGPISLKLEVGEERSFHLRIACNPAWPRHPSAFRLWLPFGSKAYLDDTALSQTNDGWFELPWVASMTLEGVLARGGA
ncbi:MAG: hypothetical protein J7463_10070 [Roseiflexus sp.]|jgi:hypothetical protein|nr:hypothetical protein [Roseiflexus sp.]MBO9334836.1 hypothetical protein [Roseiflexus sp.]MBO9390353.1 hypothetical protein [Roseiflexus sp.]